MGAQSIRNTSDPGPALTVSQETGTNPALAVANSTATGAALQVNGSGTLLDLQTSGGASKFKVDGSGNTTVGGTLSVTTSIAGTKAFRYLDMEPAGTVGATVPRSLASSSTAALTSGTIYCCAIGLDKGVTVSNVSLFVAGTAESGGTHAWVGLADSSRKVQAVSADQTGATYFSSTQTAVTTAVGSPYVTTAAGLYYVFVCVVATTPVFAAAPALENSALANVAPIVCGSADSSQTTPPAVGASLAAITATAGHLFYAWLT